MKILLFVFVLVVPFNVLAKGISGDYVASTSYGNIFCLSLKQENENITGTFDEVDFKQIVPINNGTYTNDTLRFDVTFKVNRQNILLTMSANKLNNNPELFFGNYKIGSERGDFVLYQIKAKPKVCKTLSR